MAGDGQRPGEAGFQAIGASGLRHHGGQILEEPRAELRGAAGARLLRRMADDDATTGAILRAIEAMVLRTRWHVDGERAADVRFVEQVLFEDLEQPWSDVIAEALSMLVHGWAALEIVWARRPARVGAGADPGEGAVGIARLSPRAQDSLWRWQLDEEGRVDALEQRPADGGPVRVIPAERLLLFRTVSRRNNPEGRSILRNAWRAWSLLTRLQEVEAIGIERDLAGLPVMRVPSDYLRAGTEANRALPQFEAIVRDVRLNAQGGVVIPSDVWADAEGAPGTVPMFDLTLLTTGGPRAIDTTAVALRYQRDIARSVLADFVMLGGDHGAYSLSQDKSQLFLKTLEALLAQLAGPLNRQLIARLWAVNGWGDGSGDRQGAALRPRPVLRPGRVMPEDLAPLTEMLERLARAGMPLFPDAALEAHLRDRGDLPDAPTRPARAAPDLPRDTAEAEAARQQQQQEEQEEEEQET